MSTGMTLSNNASRMPGAGRCVCRYGNAVIQVGYNWSKLASANGTTHSEEMAEPEAEEREGDETESEYECELMIEALRRELDIVRVRC